MSKIFITLIPLQIEKFAVRFPQLSDADSFLNCVKECSRATMDIIPSRSDYIYGSSSASEYITSNGLHHRLDEVACIDDPASGQRIDTPASGYHKETHEPVLEPSLVTNINSIYCGFPYSSSQMLTDCSTHNVKGEPFLVTTTVDAPEEVHTLHVPHDVVVAGKEMTADKDNGAAKYIGVTIDRGDVMSQIKDYIACDSFHEILFKLDKVIDELGGDMSL
ncbi:hypothetical protein ABZP36_020736 [Zizania latifolia]